MMRTSELVVFTWVGSAVVMLAVWHAYLTFRSAIGKPAPGLFRRKYNPDSYEDARFGGSFICLLWPLVPVIAVVVSLGWLVVAGIPRYLAATVKRRAKAASKKASAETPKEGPHRTAAKRCDSCGAFKR